MPNCRRHSLRQQLAGVPGGLILHPLFAASIVTVVANDEFLKQSGWFPPMLAGKLSDIAGLFVFPVALLSVGEVASRRQLSLKTLIIIACAVSLVFAASKLNTAAATAFGHFLGVISVPAQWLKGSKVVTQIHYQADATDLLCLPLAYLGVTAARRLRSVSSQVNPADSYGTRSSKPTTAN